MLDENAVRVNSMERVSVLEEGVAVFKEGILFSSSTCPRNGSP